METEKMMGGEKMEGLIITIEEWAGDNDIAVSESQIKELGDAIRVAVDMEQPGGYSVAASENSRGREDVEKLKRDIDLLKRYIQSKGYKIILSDGRISRTYMVDCGAYSASKHENFIWPSPKPLTYQTYLPSTSVILTPPTKAKSV